jgi:hypothetical protein
VTTSSLAAAVSSVSLVADNLLVTTIFSVLTAIVAALNAAFSPSDRSMAHRQAAKAYLKAVRDLDLLWRRLNPWGPEGGLAIPPDDNGPTEDLTAIFRMFLQLRDALESADDRAPAINRLLAPLRQPTTSLPKRGSSSFATSARCASGVEHGSITRSTEGVTRTRSTPWTGSDRALPAYLDWVESPLATPQERSPTSPS